LTSEVFVELFPANFVGEAVAFIDIEPLTLSRLKRGKWQKAKKVRSKN